MSLNPAPTPRRARLVSALILLALAAAVVGFSLAFPAGP